MTIVAMTPLPTHNLNTADVLKHYLIYVSEDVIKHHKVLYYWNDGYGQEYSAELEAGYYTAQACNQYTDPRYYKWELENISCDDIGSRDVLGVPLSIFNSLLIPEKD